jgi:hypothetical protein
VPDPGLSAYTSAIPKTVSRIRGADARMARGLGSTRHKAMEFLKRAPVFKVDLDINELTTSAVGIATHQKTCDKILGPKQQAQVFSGRWVDKNNNNLVFYLGKRWVGPLTEDVSPLVLHVTKLV